ncbi:MAG: SLC13 family permease [Thermoproteota archaeon]|nr:SLC13 family permease [Thermoproteota archaeon]
MMKHTRRLGLFLGPALFLVVLFLPTVLPEGLTFEARIVLGATLWMAVWWITEAIPIYVTALLPFIIFPSLGVTGLQETAASYADRVIFLFLGGFMLAKAMERSNLHSRFALNILKVFGTNPKYIIAAFMMVILLLGAWMSNTAITMLMLPVAIAVISQFRSSASDRERFGLCLMLSVAYSASISGVTTLIASPPNAIFASVSQEITGLEVSFSQWMAVGFPIGVISVLIAWLYMVNFGASVRGIKPITEEKGLIETKLSELGKMTRNEKLVLGVFATTAIAWVTRGLLWGEFVPTVDDSAIAVAAIFLLFVLPSSRFRREKSKVKRIAQAKEDQENIIKNTASRRIDSGSRKTDDNDDNNEEEENKGDRLLDWKTAAQIPWEVLLLIGGGIALANAFTATGLDEFVAERLIFLEGMSYMITILIIVAVTALVGEVISNTATAALMIPISASLATSLDVNPILFMVPVTIVTSYSFMLPVSTPPNTIVFASGYLSTANMIRAGLPLKIIAIAVVTVLTTLLVPFVWQ